MIEVHMQVVGLQHHRPESDQVEAEDPIRLVPEPENPYDANAIRVLGIAERFTAPCMLGYIPRNRTDPVHRLLKILDALDLQLDRHGKVLKRGDIAATIVFRIDGTALEEQFYCLFDKETILTVD